MKRGRGHETRTRIAAEALTLLREKGSAGLTMRQVATRSGLSLSNVQYHYSSREKLLIGITEHHLAICHDALDAALGGRTGLRAGLQASLCDEGVMDSAPPFRELFALALTEPAVHERLMAYYRATHDRLTVALAAHYPAADGDLVEEAATLLMTSIEGAYLLDEATPVSRQRLAHRLERVVDTLLG
jgi:AcrR family transcriptional regulator